MDYRQNGFLNCLPTHSKSLVLSAGIEKKKKKGEMIFGEWEEVQSIYFVLEGYVALFRNSRYGEIRLILVGAPGEILNEIVVERAKASIAAKTLSDVKLLCIPRNQFEKLLQKDPVLMKAVFESLSKKTRKLFHQIGNANGTYPLKKHLAAKIWKLARDYGRETDAGREIEFEITVTFLASMLGAKRESVSRALSEMKKDGILLHEKGRLTVRSMENLRTQV